ncbi:MAG: sulfite exporter TauE/SafE family protein [Candidatus Acidiferrum sp.]
MTLHSDLTLQHAIYLFFAAALGGGLNAVAGGGSFIAFPALLFTGVAPVIANATNTLALWIGTTASGGAYRKRLHLSRRVMLPLIATSVVGGIAGALLLIKTPAQTFLHVLPWLMLAATLLFAFGKHLTGRISAGIGHDASNRAVVGASIFELVVSVYGGYFGGGIGIMNLAMFAAMGMTDIHEMNALKVLLGAVINGVAAVMFIALGAIVWPQAMVMTVGATLGGYASAHYAQKLPQSWIRALVIVVGSSMTIYFFIRSLR